MSSNHHNQAKRLSVASLTVPMRGPRRMSNVSYTPISGELPLGTSESVATVISSFIFRY